MIRVRVSFPGSGVGLITCPEAGLFAKCPAVLPAFWNTMKIVSDKALNELARIHISVLVTMSTVDPGGITPPTGSIKKPQL